MNAVDLLRRTDGERVSNYIGGEFLPAENGLWLDDVDPARNQKIASIPRSTAVDVERAVSSARAALDAGWGQTAVAERASLLDAVADRIERDIERLAQLESIDTGKPVQLARTVDIPRAVANFRFFAGAVRHQSTACHPMEDALNYTLHRPVGVFGLITPWNLPLYLLSWKVAPALAMGNTVVAKPSELTPLTAAALAEIFAELEAPDGILNIVHGLGAEAGAALVAHPDAGGPIHDASGKPLDYDAYAQTEAVLENIERILEASDSSLQRNVDVTVYLIDMDRDFERFNAAYTKHMAGVGAARTTVAVLALPTPIAVELKVVATVDSE